MNPQTKTLIKQCFKGVNEEDEEDKKAAKQAAISAAAGLSCFLSFTFFLLNTFRLFRYGGQLLQRVSSARDARRAGFKIILNDFHN